MYAVRDPVAAGIFYNRERQALMSDLEKTFSSKEGPGDAEPENVTAVISPHNNYHLCGSVNAWSYSKVERANYVIIGPNHHDIGAEFSIMKEGLWKTPLGEIAVSNKLAEKILNRSNLIEYDVTAHKSEHSIETQLPFLQFKYGNDFKIIPVSVRNKFDDKEFVERCKLVGRTIAKSVAAEGEKWIIVGTTDFSRGSKSEVARTDKVLTGSLKNLSERSFFDAVHDNASYICGYGAVLTALSAAKELKAKRSKVVKYLESPEVVGDPKSFVGYASIIVR